MKKHSFLDRSFKDSRGAITLGQTPNPPIIVWLLTTIIGVFLTVGKLASIIEIISFGALFTWAWLELFQGVNYFRRALGLIVLVFTIYNQVNK